MTHIDNSKIFHNGVYADVSVYVPKQTTYVPGTVLGRDSSGNLTAFSTDLNVAGDGDTAAFTSSPLYILAQTVTNEDTSNPATIDLVRVFDSGVVDKNGLVFVKEADATDKTVLDALKTNNFRLVNVEELTTPSSLGE